MHFTEQRSLVVGDDRTLNEVTADLFLLLIELCVCVCIENRCQHSCYFFICLFLCLFSFHIYLYFPLVIIFCSSFIPTSLIHTLYCLVFLLFISTHNFLIDIICVFFPYIFINNLFIPFSFICLTIPVFIHFFRYSFIAVVHSFLLLFIFPLPFIQFSLPLFIRFLLTLFIHLTLLLFIHPSVFHSHIPSVVHSFLPYVVHSILSSAVHSVPSYVVHSSLPSVVHSSFRCSFTSSVVQRARS